jgi:CBS domain-containing protein
MTFEIVLQTVREVMTPGPVTIGSQASLTDAARVMRDNNIGDVIVCDDSVPLGILTDRDIVVRAVATGTDNKTTTVGQVCSRDIVAVSPDDDLDRAVSLMRGQSVRRLPVIQDNQVVGIVSLGDIAIDHDPLSALADISMATPNR